MKECQFDLNCGGFTFDGETCTKSTLLEYTDVLYTVPPSSVGYVKVGFSALYWSGICSTAETESVCDATYPSLCAWGTTGRRGSNDAKIISDGFCRRIGCNL
jgi:hypothetical protein